MTITTSRPAPLDIDALRSRFSGWVIGPADPDYDAERTVLPGGIDASRRSSSGSPAPTTSRAVDRPRPRDRPRAGRPRRRAQRRRPHHGRGRHRPRRPRPDALDIDVEGRTAWAAAGLTAVEYTKAADEHGLATGFGDTGSVGHRRAHARRRHRLPRPQHGLTIDNLLAAEIVTADGEVHVVDADHEPDLFWAIRGGGGNFGVATRFHFRLHAVAEVVGGMLFLPATPERSPGSSRRPTARPTRCRRSPTSCPARRCRSCPRSTTAARDHGACCATPGRPSRRARSLAPFRALAEPLADMVRPMPLPGDVPAGGRGLPPDRGRADALPRLLDAS